MATYTSIHTGGAIDSGITLTDQIARQNVLINGGMMVAQRGTSFTSATTPANSDDTYLLDRWILLSDGNDIVDVSQATDAPTGALNSIAFDVETINKKFGILQIIEQKNAIDLIGGVASLSFQAKMTGSSLSNIKAAVLSWSSTPDAVTSDIVSAWNADDTLPTWTTDWTAENTPANLSITTAWAEYTIENISIDTASAANIAVFIWCDDLTTTLTDFLYLTNIKLERGAVATPFVGGIEDNKCKRYAVQLNSLYLGYTHSTPQLYNGTYIFPVEMRVTPSLDNASFAVESGGGNAGTPGLQAVTSTFANFYNSDYGANPWTADELISITGLLDAEL